MTAAAQQDASAHGSEPASTFPWWPLASRREVTLLTALVALAFVLRLMLAMKGGLWRDECTFLFTLELPTTAAMLDFLRLQDSHPPLHYLLSRAWMTLFGNTETAAVAFPLLLGVALVPAIYLVGARLLGPRTGLLAAAFVTLSPGLGEVATLVRPYAFMALICLATVAALWRSLSSGKPHDWAIYSVVTLAMILGHNWAWLVWGSQMLAVGGWVLSGQGRPPRTVLTEYILACTAIVVGYAWWFPVMFEQLAHAGHSPFHQGTGVALLVTFLRHLGQYLDVVYGCGGHRPLHVVTVLMVFATGIAFVPLAGRMRPTTDERLALWILLAVPVFSFAAAYVLSAKNNLLIGHCFPIVTPCVLLLLAHAVVVGSDAWPGRARAVELGAVLLVAVVMAKGWFSLANSAKSNAREIAAFVTQHARADDLVIVAPIFLASSFNYYFRLPNEQLDYPEAGRHGEVSFNDMGKRMAAPEALQAARSAITRARRDGRRVWLVSGLRTTPSGSDKETDAAALPKGYTIDDWGPVSALRTRQLWRHLGREYGRPTLISPDPIYLDMPLEQQVALLFDVPKP